MIDETRERVVSLIEPCLVSQGFDLVEVSVSCGKRTNFIQIFADKPQGGITIYECATINKAIGAILEEENFLDGNYTLEVSSPGVDRPLLISKDFLRAHGREIMLCLKEPVHGILEHRGIVQRVEDENVYIKNKNGEVGIPIQCVNKANQVI